MNEHFELRGRREEKAKKELEKLKKWKRNVWGKQDPFTDSPRVFELELPVGQFLPTLIPYEKTVPKTIKPNGGS